MAKTAYPVAKEINIIENNGEAVGISVTLQQTATERLKGKPAKTIRFAIPLENMDAVLARLQMASLPADQKNQH